MISLPDELPTVVLPIGTLLWRVNLASLGMVWFGPAAGDGPRNRFDAPGGEYGICYLGASPEVAVVETVIRQPRMRLVSRTTMESRRASRTAVKREMKLTRLHGPGLVHLGIGADVVHGHPYAECQQLALALWRHPDAIDGIQYRSRWDNDCLCVALFDRAADALAEPDQSLSLADPTISGPILRMYGVGVI